MKKLLKIITSIVILLSSFSSASAATLFPGSGGTGTSTVPTLGQILAGLNSGIYAPLVVGTNGTILSASSTSSTGLSWISPGITNAYASSTVLYIAANGNVGIGTITPSSLLTVAGDVAATGMLSLPSTTATSSILGNFMFGNSLNGGNLAPVGFNGIPFTYPQLQISANPDAITGGAGQVAGGITIANTGVGAYDVVPLIFNNASSTFLGANSSNYAVIGFTGPNFTGYSGLPANSLGIESTDGALIFDVATSTPSKAFMAWGVGPGYTSANYDMILKSLLTTSLSASSTDTGLGLGTSSPIAKLSIEASSTASYPFVAINTVNETGVRTPIFYINNNGNVGIGTTTPSQLLTVGNNNQFTVDSSGNTNMVGGLGIGVNNTTAGGIYFNRAGGDPFFLWEQSGSTVGQIRADSTENGIYFANSTGTSHYLDVITGGTSAGNVGIGTTSPLAKLEVYGTAGNNAIANFASSTNASALYIAASGNVGIGMTNPTANLYVQGSAAVANQTAFQVIGQGQAATTFVLNNNNASFNNSLFYGYTTATGNGFKMLDLRAGGVAVMTVDGAGNGYYKGNVGIGTTTPLAKFEVYGTAGNNAIANFASSSNDTIYKITASGHISTASSTKFTPTLTSCGTSPSIVGNDIAGRVTVGSVSASGCTITFVKAFTNIPSVVLVNESASVVNAMSYTVSTTTITVSQTGLTGDVLDYHVYGIGE
jgi:hypothetical protein